jgi:hypothetical protein
MTAAPASCGPVLNLPPAARWLFDTLAADRRPQPPGRPIPDAGTQTCAGPPADPGRGGAYAHLHVRRGRPRRRPDGTVVFRAACDPTACSRRYTVISSYVLGGKDSMGKRVTIYLRG